MNYLHFAFLAATLLVVDATDLKDDDLIVSVQGSLVRAHILETDMGNKYFAYQEIPYAQPPLGNKRFQLPVKAGHWNGILNNKSTRRMCLQRKKPDYLPDAILTEDCLLLSVYSPAIPHSYERYPVMFWIHGGGFVTGSGDFRSYNPKLFIDEKIVVVTINYRLGPLGFLTTGDNVIPANLGLYDQLLALKWVHDNIEGFGGNRSNVVIAGESAGAASVSWHLIGPKVTNLYSGAIMQSGSAMCPFANSFDVYQSAVKYTKAINPTFEPTNSSSILEFLQSATTEQLQMAFVDELGVYSPTIDTGLNFAQYPTEAYEKRQIKMIPVLFGYNSEESLTFLKNQKLAIDQAAKMDEKCTMDKKYNILDKDRETACLKLKQAYTNVTFVKDIPAFIKFTTEERITRPMLKSIHYFSKRIKDVFLYQLSYRPSFFEPYDFKGISGVGHAEDLALLFDACRPDKNITDTDMWMAKRMVRLWANFIKYRNPTPFPETLLGNVTMPRVTPEQLSYLDLDTEITISTNPRNSNKWLNILDKYLQRPIAVY